MSISPEELTIIADDGRGLSRVDRESIREAAADLDAIFNSYHRLLLDFVELERANVAQAERIRELTKKLFIPSWARFPNVRKNDTNAG